MSLPSGYFDDVYAGSTDPWGFADRWYEERKRALTLALLPEQTYRTAYEPGCSIGVLTRELAGRCDALLATDVASSAVEAARQRCADLQHVTVQQGGLLDTQVQVDLVVLSEVLYYLAYDEAVQAAARCLSFADTVVAVHWRHPVADYPLSGDQAHEVLEEAAAAQRWTRLALHLEDDLVAGVWSRDARSVAERDGLA